MKKGYCDPLEGFEKDPFRKLYKKDAAEKRSEHVHVYREKIVCGTDKKGFPTPENRSPLDLVVNAPGGRIPLWDQHVNLRWRFNESSFSVFRDPDAAKAYVRTLLALGIQLWGDGVPVTFTEQQTDWDFEMVMSPMSDCDTNGCTLASAFFPDGGQHELVLYPTMFEQTPQEQVETMAHELGHVFGLRHFFALVDETLWPAKTFGTHSKFSIMNYGSDSFMTQNDRDDLQALYDSAWSGDLTEINGTPIALVRPFSDSTFGPIPFDLAALRDLRLNG